MPYNNLVTAFKFYNVIHYCTQTIERSFIFSRFFFIEKTTIVVVRDVCPSVVCGNNFFSR